MDTVNTKNLHKLDVKKMHFIRESIGKLDTNEHLEIFKIIKNYTDKYSENNNGIFINMSYLEDEALWKIHNFIEFCLENKIQLNDDQEERKNYKEIMSSHIKKIDSKKEMEDFSNTSNNSDNVSSYEFENNVYSFIKENEKNNIILNDKEGEIAMSESKFNLSINRIRPKYTGVQHRILKKCRDSNNSVQNSQIINKKI